MEPFLVGTLWGICSLASMAAAVRWHFPYIRSRTEGATLPEKNSTMDFQGAFLGEKKEHGNIFRSRLYIAAVVLLACTAGFRADFFADSYISLIKLLIGSCVVSCAVMTDLEFMLIPNFYIEVLLIARVLLLLPEYLTDSTSVVPKLVSSLIGLLFCLFTLFIVSVVTRGGLGYGDVKLVACLAFLTGLYAGINTIILSCFSCGIAAAYFLLSGRKGLKDAIAFAPFILLGYEVMIIIAAY